MPLTWANGYKEYEKFVTVTWPATVGAKLNENFIDPSIEDLDEMEEEGELYKTENNNGLDKGWWTRESTKLKKLRKELTKQQARLAKLTLKNLQLP